MENDEIVKLLKLTADLMELHETNEFKVRSWQNAAFQLDKIQTAIASMTVPELEAQNGVGKSLAKKIAELSQTGKLTDLEELLQVTPPGVLQMLQVKGIGPKKVRSLWKELAIEDREQLLEACYQGKIAGLKGFGEKTQQSIVQSIEFQRAQRGKLWYADAEILLNGILNQIKQITDKVSPTGQIRRKLPVIDKVELLVGYSDYIKTTSELVSRPFWNFEQRISGPLVFRGNIPGHDILIEIILTPEDEFYNKLLLSSASGTHLAKKIGTEGRSIRSHIIDKKWASEADFYTSLGLPDFHPELREGIAEFELASNNLMEDLVKYQDLKGILHNHSTWSDGKNSIEEMAKGCIDLGYEYFGITDHSRSATYANGLSIEKLQEQISEIDHLNEKLRPFRIFKGIESDILYDGSLDYPEEILAQLDFVVASIHSTLKMDIKKATARLIKAIENPHTTILGHPTGRLLLKREGYPIDHRSVIDACAENKVAIEINADPWRLDLDWIWVPYAMTKGVMVGINPDAHDKESLENMKYGFYCGLKGGLLKKYTLNALSVNEMDTYLHSKKAKKAA